MLIEHTPTTNFQGRIYPGPWSSDVFSHKPVNGIRGSYAGSYVCTSGAYTSEHCNIKIDWVKLAVKFSDGFVRYPITSATHATGVAVGRRDSGGPVHTGYSFTVDPSHPFSPIISYDGTMAMGTNAAGLKDFPCPTGSHY